MAQQTDLSNLARELKVIAEPKRLEILALLMQGVQCNCELGDKLDMAPNLISHHLRVLHKAGLIQMERDPLDSRWIYYSIHRAAVSELLGQLEVFFDASQIQERNPNCGPHKSRDCNKRSVKNQYIPEVKL